ncbi:FtsX-like permease family protein [Massilia arenosa]|uniref:FtsX-like permease family protein n=1 Tax=Zemynaea arenosa TaxID=2561931 RepID=A0A4Y9SXP3_9BURK|nr:FtsX-like permease family protein [Massilia arenosa]TFW29403.1 FtsX-like permease family protein [Massilia arenosa]
MLNLRDFRIGWRLLIKEPAYSAVVILGLAIGFAVCFLLLGFVRHSFSYDQHVPDHDRIFLVKQRWNTVGSSGEWGQQISLPGRDAIVASGVPLLATTAISHETDVLVDGHVQTIEITTVDPAFQQIFQPKVLSGDLKTTLLKPDNIALTRETATRLFNSINVAGQSVRIAGKPYLIGAVLEDPPAATVQPYAALAGIKTAIWDQEYRHLVETNWGSSHGPVYVKFTGTPQPGPVQDAILRAMLNSAFYKRMSPQQVAALNGQNALDFALMPLADVYLDPDVRNNGGSGDIPHGDRKSVLGLAAVAVLILLLAATNYVNLATVRTLRRQREIAVRKVIGASAGQVSRQFLAESILVCLIATAIGLLLAWLLLPVFGDLVQRKFDHMFDVPALLISLALGVSIGLASGAYPTWSALKVRPTSALQGRGNAETTGGLWMRRVLTVLQFGTAMGLTGLTLSVAWQTQYASSLDPGFDASSLLVVEAPDDMRKANTSAFRDAVKRIPGVTGVALSDAPVTRNHNSTALQREGGNSTEIHYLLVDPDFFDVYGLKPVSGRLYNRSMDKIEDDNKIVINEAGIKALGFASAQEATGKFVHFPMTDSKSPPMQVVGVAPDIRHRSARETMQPTVYFLENRTAVLSVRAPGHMEEVQHAIEEMWPRFFPNAVLDIKRMPALFSRNYDEDRRLAKLLASSSLIAIAIAAFGIYVLSAYSVQRRTREIVLRKLYGAGGADIGKLVAREFMALIGIGALIGLPVAWLATQRYLSSFTEKAPIGLWTVAFALGVALLVALVSTLRHTFSAMRITPVLALRD